MKQNKYIFSLLIIAALFINVSCKKQLDVKNPNYPTLANAETETGIISLATGAVYTNGFNTVDVNGLTILGNSYFFIGLAYHELLGDVVSAEAANTLINVVSLPEYVILDNGTKVSNTSNSKNFMRISNARDKRANNPFYFEWTYMYALNNACNNVLSIVDQVTYTGEAETKKNTIKAWCYFWKGFAYSKIGSLYYSGLISNSTIGASNKYLIHDSIIGEANKNLDLASSIVNSITKPDVYSSVLGQLLPKFLQQGHGGILTPTMFAHNINTLKARNLLANKKASLMTAADWASLSTLTTNGIQSGEFIFTARTNPSNGFFTAGSGSVTAGTTGDPNTKTFTISERVIQDYKTGDKRFANNFQIQLNDAGQPKPYLNQVGGFTYSTRWALIDGGKGMPGVQTLSNLTPGQYELPIAGSYEENELMKAESKIYSGDIEGGLKSIDAVRTYLGAGLAAVAGTNLTQAQALEELRRERRVALMLRGLSFYDARRWGIIYDISAGGGRKGAVVLTSTGVLNTNATINYNFLDYWDVPADEFELNIPAAGSAPVKNPG